MASELMTSLLFMYNMYRRVNQVFVLPIKMLLKGKAWCKWKENADWINCDSRHWSTVHGIIEKKTNKIHNAEKEYESSKHEVEEKKRDDS